MDHRNRPHGRRPAALAAALLTISLVASGCGGSKKGEKTESLKSAALNSSAGESGLAKAGTPQRGGTITYGMEADSNDGFCLPEAQLAISGMLVVRAVYDTLVVPNAEGDYVPYLAKSIEHNDAYDEWTIGLRDGVKFHDGTDVTAEVVKNNIDAYRGAYPSRHPLLFSFVLSNIDSVTATDAKTVVVKTKVPWVAFPAHLYSSSRFGIMAQSQLDDANSCDRKLVGTGPFKFTKWVKDQEFVAERNPDYWQTAPDGKPYPYADKLVLQPMPEGTVRNNALLSGEIDILHTSNAEDIGDTLRKGRDDGKLNLLVSEDQSEPAFVQLNATKPPFDDENMRKALAYAVDRTELNEEQNDGLPTVANGPYAPDSVGYVKDPGFPKVDVAKAKELVAAYVKDGGDPSFALGSGQDASTQRLADNIRQRATAVGFKVTVTTADQAKQISAAIAKEFQATLWRNFPGGDPDINYVWWYGKGNPVNFSGYDDPDINAALDEARSEPDPDKRKALYQGINKVFAERAYELWTWYTPWAVAEAADVHGILGPPLPGDDPSTPGDATTDDPARQPSTGLATAHSLIGLWKEK